jgi:hypothetical protein
MDAGPVRTLRRLERLLMIGAVAGPITTGCAPPLTALSVRGEWVKPGIEAQQLRKDFYECERHAVTTGDDEACSLSTIGGTAYLRALGRRGASMSQRGFAAPVATRGSAREP